MEPGQHELGTVGERRSPAVEALREALRGPLIDPSDPRYAEACQLYNAMIHKRPALIAQCQDVADVIAAVDFAQELELPVAVRGGGHSGPGLGSCDGGLVIDLSRMRGIRVEPEAHRVRVEGGCVWGDVDHATHAFGMATPSGIIASTGVGGLTLGGGHGHLTRKYGLTIDNLLSADVVLPDGRFVHASRDDHEDLFWALRGGGGNFGVVTSFEFKLHPVLEVYAGPTLWALEDMAEVMRWYREALPAFPDDINGFFASLVVPPAPPFPAELHGKKMCGVIWCCTTDAGTAEEMLEPLRAFRDPVFEHLGMMPYPALQSAFDPLYPPGLQWYWRGDFVREIPDEAVERHIEFLEKMPTALSSMHLYPIDGAVHRVDESETAFAYRDANWSQVIVGVDPDPGKADLLRQWTVDYWEALHPYSAGAAYVNFMMEEGRDRVRATYGENYDRLARIKGEYDPDNLLHINQNIPPAYPA